MASTISIPVTFTTTTQYPLPPQKYLIPSNWKRYQLSQLINKALSLDRPVPFDFIVKNDGGKGWLRGTVGDVAEGGEETLDLEYIESVVPPQKLAEIPQEEWVSDVRLSKGTLLTASYDGSIRTLDYSQHVTSSTRVHDAPITSACVVSSREDAILVATASHDLTARLTSIKTDGSESSAIPLVSLHLHTAPLSYISANSDGSQLLTASWDTLIGVWNTSVPDDDEVPPPQEVSRKKRKLNSDGQHAKRKAPSTVLRSHTNRVSSVLWNATNGAVSCGFDSTVRTWDVERGLCSHTINASEKPFLSLCLPSTSLFSSTILASSTDRTVTLYDIRTPEAGAAASLSSLISFHSLATPSCLASSGNQVAAGCYDGMVRVWDLRGGSVSGAGGEVSNFRAWGPGREEKKVLSVDWDQEGGLMAVGGEGGLAMWKMGKHQ